MLHFIKILQKIPIFKFISQIKTNLPTNNKFQVHNFCTSSSSKEITSAQTATQTPRPARDLADDLKQEDHKFCPTKFCPPINVDIRIFREFDQDEILGPHAHKELIYKNPEYFAYHRYSFCTLVTETIRLSHQKPELEVRIVDKDNDGGPEFVKKEPCPKEDAIITCPIAEEDCKPIEPCPREDAIITCPIAEEDCKPIEPCPKDDTIVTSPITEEDCKPTETSVEDSEESCPKCCDNDKNDDVNDDNETCPKDSK